jgi:flagellar basal-body rod protein FlgC
MANELFSSMHIAASGMSAQRSRMDIVAENIANSESTRTAEGGAYRRRQVVFQATPIEQNFSDIFRSSLQRGSRQSVRVVDVVQDQRPFREVYDPAHPDANADGMVQLPNVNMVEEMVDMNSAARSFEANVTSMEASKRMFIKSLELLR